MEQLLMEAPVREKKPRLWLRKGAVHLLILGMVYANLAVMLDPAAVPHSIRLPVPRWVYDAFILFGVFNTYETINKELVIWGLAEGAPNEEAPGAWMQLETEEFFPMKKGEQLARAYVSHHQYMLGRPGQQYAWGQLAQKIRNRHNKLHPDRPIRSVAIQLETWPRSVRLYEENRNSEAARTYTWYRER